MAAKPWTSAPGGVTLNVRVTVRCARDQIAGMETLADGRVVLKARLRAVPVEGEANEALRRLLAKALGIAPRQVEIATGATARLKRLVIAGDPRTLEAKLERLMQERSMQDNTGGPAEGSKKGRS
jgi:hypothetical protein